MSADRMERARGPRAPWRLAFMLALAATLSGILLTGVSVWFLGAVALAGLGPAAIAFNFHFPAALVRLFALTRTAAKYGERLVGHQAALGDQVRRRARLFTAMASAPSVRTGSWQLGNQDRLSDYMEDVEDVDYARLRVGMPVATLAAVTLLAGLATLVLAPLAMVPIAALAALTGLGIRATLPRAESDWGGARMAQRAAGRRLGAALGALVPLIAERAWTDQLATSFERFGVAGAARLDLRRRLAALDLLIGVIGPLAALSVLLVGWHANARGESLLVPAFLAFTWLAIGDAAQMLTRAALGRVRAVAAGRSLAQWAGDQGEETNAVAIGPMQALRLDEVPLSTPTGRPLGGEIALTLRAGRPTALVGPSGTGKTTLLKQIAGWIGGEDRGRFTGAGRPLASAERCALTHLAPHDAAVLADTIRENLFAPESSEDSCLAALDAVELGERVRMAGGLSGWITQDVLSLGEAQRLGLARAMLCRAPVVILDEPTEHLDAEQGARILERVLARLSDRIVVFATHDPRAADLAEAVVDCAAVARARPAEAAA